MKSIVRLVLFTAVAPAASSQSVLYSWDGDSKNDRFGTSVSGAGDVNGDGVPDLIVGAWGDSNNGKASGSARVFSGVDGSILYTFDGDSGSDRLGVSVSGVGDVNGDGYADVIAGTLFANYARVFSGVDGSVLYNFTGDSPNDQLGYYVSSAGDVNGDGVPDLIVGAPFDRTKGEWSGSARVFSGRNGDILYTFYGDKRYDLFGASVDGAGDVNGDGFDDLIVGIDDSQQTGPSGPGRARVFSGVDGSILYTFIGTSQNDSFGGSVSGAGDVNGDGFDDMIVGANGQGSGQAQVFSGVDGSILHSFNGNSDLDFFGGSVSGAGDVNGDGTPDLLVGATQGYSGTPDAGYVRAFSGLDGSVLYTFGGDSPDDMFGFSVSGAGDVNGDGLADLIVGAVWDDNNDPFSGSASVFSGCDSLGTNYCTPAVPNSTGQSAVISACGSDLADGGYFMLHATKLPRSQFGYFLASATQGFIANPGGSQGNLCLGGQIARFKQQVQNSGKSGKLAIRVDLTSIPTTPPHTVLTGETWNFQAWFRDKNPGNTSNFTDGVAVTFL